LFQPARTKVSTFAKFGIGYAAGRPPITRANSLSGTAFEQPSHRFQCLKMISPCLHHLSSQRHVFSKRISSAHVVSITVGYTIHQTSGRGDGMVDAIRDASESATIASPRFSERLTAQ
jgi:hypothetical protein